jgi:hypothetical protein
VITIAGSGPSTEGFEHVTVATKKRSVPSDYVMVHFPYQGDKHDLPLMSYHKRNEGRRTAWYCDTLRWNKYWSQFIRMKRPPQRVKPSLGLCAVFACVERWNIDEVGLIGYDNILDGNDTWLHDAIAEKQCIESLVKIIDLRRGS